MSRAGCFYERFKVSVFLLNRGAFEGYLYLSVKNSYRRYWSHQRHVENYVQHIKHLSDEDMESEVVTSEVIAYLSQAVEVLAGRICCSIADVHRRLFARGDFGTIGNSP